MLWMDPGETATAGREKPGETDRQTDTVNERERAGEERERPLFIVYPSCGVSFFHQRECKLRAFEGIKAPRIGFQVI